MRTGIERAVKVETAKVTLEGILAIPEDSHGVVLFAHGSGSGRFSPRNQFVARQLQQEGLSTLLIDLLEEWESEDRQKVFNIDLLADRLIDATEWLSEYPDTESLNIGYFGASTGAAAALQAAAKLSQQIGAVVSRGGRPDLAMEYLPSVKAPTLLIVGGLDYPVIELNQHAYDRLTSEKQLVIVPGAGHLFEEGDTLKEVARLAREWFIKYIGQT
ncbi:MAG TPA: dienelactone hydrolase family protein [Armatimonadota bacterium]|nr:dienelactone hydrolase family protein [Armatimonadota bacterium]